jgi:acyl carrier protein
MGVADRSDRSIEDRIMDIVSDKLDKPRDSLSKDMSFVNDLGADSLDTVELMMDLEDEFDLSIPEEEAEKIVTLGDAIKYVEEHL